MSNKIRETRRKIKTKVDAIKRTKDNAEKNKDKFIEKYEQKALKGSEDLSKNLSDFVSKKYKKLESGINRKSDVFSDLIETVENFLNGKAVKVEPTDKLMTKQRLRQITNESINATAKNSQQIVMDAVEQILFAGDGICGSNRTFGSTSNVNIKPQEFDFLNILTVDPTTSAGKIVYEDENKNSGLIKMNKRLYDTFSGGTQNFITKSGTTLFSYSWDTNNQEYNVTGLSAQKLSSFFKEYYSNIEPIDFSGITKTAIYLTLHGDGSEPPLFDKGWNDLNRLLQKLCAMCGNPKNSKIPNATTEFNENDEDIQSYFNFDDVEGIDLDDENDRLEKVLKFRDCNNYKIPINPIHFEDFVDDDDNLSDAVNNALRSAAVDAHNQSDGNIPPDNFHLTIMNSFLLNLPKALIGSVFTPKFFFPIILIYKSVINVVSGVIKTAKEIMKELWKLFNYIVTKLLWNFISEFWVRVKKDLLVFLSDVALSILKKKTKRYRRMLLALIAIITKILETGLDNCKNLYDLINKAIDVALSGFGGGFATAGISTFMLPFFLQKPGFSEDRATINSVEMMEESGISTGPIFGEANNIIPFVKSIIEGMTKEKDENGFVAVSNNATIIPHPSPFVGSIFIPPGFITNGGGEF